MASVGLKDPTNVSSVISDVFGGDRYNVSQQFGVAGFRSDWYAYSSGLGWPGGYHVGLDIAVPKGTPIYSNTYGQIAQAGWSDSFRPNPVTLITEDDPDTKQDEAGSKIIFGHLWSAAVKAGQQVRPGDLLGYSGEQTVKGTMTPDGSGPHLHYETRMKSNETTTGEFAVNPLPFLAGNLPAGDALNSSGDIIVDVPNDGSTGDNPYQDNGCGLTDISCHLSKLIGGTIADYAGRAGALILGAMLIALGVRRVIA